MEAALTLYPPEAGGEDIRIEQIRAALAEAGVTTGLLEPIICMAARAKTYGKRIVVARGTPVQHGEDGEVEDCFEREIKIHPTVDAEGRIDYKNLNIVREVQEGTVICRIRRETPARNGKTVLGEVLVARVGKPIRVPMGRNTALSDDGGALVASCGGNLIFMGEQFHVEKVLRIYGDVDNSVGNLRYSWDIDIGGDVREGFEVHSGGNVFVRGSVEGALIEAAGNITLTKGMNGMRKGRLNAGKDIFFQYLENAEVHAGGSLCGDSMRNCRAVAGEKVVLSGEHGLLSGGKCSARKGVEAQCIGASSRVPIEITLGVDVDAQERMRELEKRAAWLNGQLDIVSRDLAYLNRMVTQNTLSEERMRTRAEKEQKRIDLLEEINQISERLESLEEAAKPDTEGRLAGRKIYPPLTLTIGPETVILKEEEADRFFYFKEGQIRRGAMV